MYDATIDTSRGAMRYAFAWAPACLGLLVLRIGLAQLEERNA